MWTFALTDRNFCASNISVARAPLGVLLYRYRQVSACWSVRQQHRSTGLFAHWSDSFHRAWSPASRTGCVVPFVLWLMRCKEIRWASWYLSECNWLIMFLYLSQLTNFYRLVPSAQSLPLAFKAIFSQWGWTRAAVITMQVIWNCCLLVWPSVCPAIFGIFKSDFYRFLWSLVSHPLLVRCHWSHLFRNISVYLIVIFHPQCVVLILSI